MPCIKEDTLHIISKISFDDERGARVRCTTRLLFRLSFFLLILHSLTCFLTNPRLQHEQFFYVSGSVHRLQTWWDEFKSLVFFGILQYLMLYMVFSYCQMYMVTNSIDIFVFRMPQQQKPSRRRGPSKNSLSEVLISTNCLICQVSSLWIWFIAVHEGDLLVDLRWNP